MTAAPGFPAARSRVLARATAPFRTSFARHAGMLTGGQFAAAAVSILAAPVLGRLYPPVSYGVLASYMAVAGVLSTLANWQLSGAILTEGSDRRAFALVRTCLWASAITACGALLLAAGINLWPDPGHAIADAAAWFWLLPATVLSAGLVAAWGAIANRFARYRTMALNQAAAAVITAAVSITLGLAGWGVAGLMLAYFAGQAWTLAAYWRVWRALERPRPPSRRRAFALARRHRRFAIWTTPSMFIGQFAIQIPIYALTAVGNLAMVGGFSRGRQLLLLPLGLIGQSVAQVFRQRAAADIARTGHCAPLFRKTALTLGLLGLPPTLLLMAIAPWAFALFLGPRWAVAGEIARILAPMLLLQLLTSPLSTVYYIRNRHAEDAGMQLGFALLTCAAVVAPLALGWSALAIVVAYSIAQSAMYVGYGLRSWQLARAQARS